MTSKRVSTSTPTAEIADYLTALLQDATLIPAPHGAKRGPLQTALWANWSSSSSIGWVPATGPFESGEDGTHYYMATVAEGKPAFAIIGYRKVMGIGMNGEKTTVKDSTVYAVISFSDQNAFDSAHNDIRALLVSILIAEGDDLLASFRA